MATEKPKKPVDHEAKALTNAVSELSLCDERSQRRVVTYLVDKFLPKYRLTPAGGEPQKQER